MRYWRSSVVSRQTSVQLIAVTVLRQSRGLLHSRFLTFNVPLVSCCLIIPVRLLKKEMIIIVIIMIIIEN